MPKVEYIAGDKKGQIEEVSEEKKVELLDLGVAKEAVETGKVENLDEGLNAAEFAESSSKYLGADILEEGDIIKIRGPGEINETDWETERLELPVEHKGEQYTLSLSKENTRNIIKEFGEDTRNWVGKKIRVVLIKEYPQLGTKGPILKPAERVGRGKGKPSKAKA